MAKKPNHICKWSGCTLGENGTRRAYWACDWCDASHSYLSVACCKEHYDNYIKEVLAARESGKKDEKLDLEPERTDKTKAEMKKMKRKSLKQIKKETEKELHDYADENGVVNIAEAVEKINAEIVAEANAEVAVESNEVNHSDEYFE